MTSRAGIKLWLRVHRYASLICTLFLLLACLTGLPLIFKEEIERASMATVPTPAPPAGPELSIDAIVARVRQTTPHRFVQFVFWEDGRDDVVGLGLANAQDAELADVQRVLVGRRTARVMAEPGQGQGQRAMDTLLALHSDLLMGEVGDVALGVVGLLFVVSTLSGIAIYGPFMRRLDFGVIRTTSARRTMLDLHNLVGIATAAWALVVGGTGLMNTLEARLFGAWQDERLPALLSAHANDAPLRGTDSLASAVSSARSALPGMRVTSIGLAGTRYGTPRHHLVWMHGSSTLTQRLFTPVLVDAATGALERAEPLPWYLRALEVARPLHFGDYGGLTMKLLWACLDLLLIGVLATGVYLWFARGQDPRGPGSARATASLSREAIA
jgi:uncharacterized iron-regulated membrane protein